MVIRRLKNFINMRIITGVLTTCLMILGLLWYFAEGGYEPAIAAIAGIAGFVSFFQYSFLSFDKNLVTSRIALVVGNADYQHAPSLLNAVTDANAVCDCLRVKGFKIIRKLNPSTSELRKSIEDFQTILSIGGVGLFYYSGHAAQIDGRNYILPVDSLLKSQDDFVNHAIDLNELLKPVDQIIDESPEHNGSVIIYSTASGRDAFDWFEILKDDQDVTDIPRRASDQARPEEINRSSHSPFANSFLRLAEKWNLEIFDLFRELLKDVRRQTEALQIPWIAASVDTEFYFKPIMKEEIGLLKILIFDACRTSPFYRPPLYYVESIDEVVLSRNITTKDT